MPWTIFTGIGFIMSGLGNVHLALFSDIRVTVYSISK